jgi:hypothetical protein
MASAVGGIDLALAPDGLDEARFAKLLKSLPAELAASSEQWVNWFLERSEDAAPFTPYGKYFARPETLANHNASKLRSGARTVEQSGMGTEPLPTASV